MGGGRDEAGEGPGACTVSDGQALIQRHLHANKQSICKQDSRTRDQTPPPPTPPLPAPPSPTMEVRLVWGSFGGDRLDDVMTGVVTMLKVMIGMNEYAHM